MRRDDQANHMKGSIAWVDVAQQIPGYNAANAASMRGCFKTRRFHNA